MNRLLIQGIAFVLMLVVVPLTSFGTTNGIPALSIAGLVVLGLAGLVPPVLRFVPGGDDD